MKYLFTILSWIFGLFFFFLFLLSLYAKHYVPSIFVLIISLLLIPPVRHWLGDTAHIPLPGWLCGLLVPILFFLFVFLIFKGMGNNYSIYKNSEIENGLMSIYDQKMTQWPVAYETRDLQTQYGNVHVIICGAADAEPVFLLHASAMASWSWLYNMQELSRYYRIYAVDTIGDAGKSVLADANVFPKDGKTLSEFYKNIMDQLGVVQAVFVGASQGGFISTNLALYAPERVKKLVLCGPMGYTGTNSSVLRIVFTTMFPVKPIQQSATRWAFGDDPYIISQVNDWFRLILEGVISRQARPQPFTQEQLQSLSMPVLLLLGTKDGLVGNPENTKKLGKNIKDIRVNVLETGHLISAEKPDEFNSLVLDFIGRPQE